MVGLGRRFRFGSCIAGIRYESTASTNRVRWYDALRRHYEHLGDSKEYSAELARQHIRWLIEGAKARAKEANSKWEDLANKMVMEDIVQKNKPLAYVLGLSQAQQNRSAPERS